jgi:SnoaL-like domain
MASGFIKFGQGDQQCECYLRTGLPPDWLFHATDATCSIASNYQGLSMDIEILYAEREIQRALYAFARAMDERDWGAFDMILAVDANADMGSGMVYGRAAIVSLMRSYLDKSGPCQHLLGNITIEIAGDSATSTCCSSVMTVGAGQNSHLNQLILGDYHDRWQKRQGHWYVLERRRFNRAFIGPMAVYGLEQD